MSWDRCSQKPSRPARHDIRALLAEALAMGDEAQSQQGCLAALSQGARAAYRQVAPDANMASEILRFLGDNALSVLNPVMAACKAMADAAHGVEGSTIVTVMARNGTTLAYGSADWATSGSLRQRVRSRRSISPALPKRTLIRHWRQHDHETAGIGVSPWRRQWLS